MPSTCPEATTAPWFSNLASCQECSNNVSMSPQFQCHATVPFDKYMKHAMTQSPGLRHLYRWRNSNCDSTVSRLLHEQHVIEMAIQRQELTQDIEIGKWMAIYERISNTKGEGNEAWSILKNCARVQPNLWVSEGCNIIHQIWSDDWNNKGNVCKKVSTTLISRCLQVVNMNGNSLIHFT